MPRRHAWLSAAVFLAVLAGAAGAAVAYRAPILGFALESYLAHAGFPEARLEVSEFSLERIALSDVSLSESGPSAAAIIAESYLNLLRNDVDRFRLTVQSPRAIVDLGQTGGPSFEERKAQIEPLLETYRDLLPILDLRDLVLTVRGGAGRELTVAADVITRVDWPSFGFSVKGTASGAGAHASFDFRSGGSAEMPGMRLDAEGTADLASLPWPAGLAVPTAGTASFKIETLLPLPTLIESFADAFARFDGTGKLELELSGVSLPDRAKDVTAALSLEGDGNLERVRLRLTKSAEFGAAGLTLPELESMGPVGAALAGELGRGAKAVLSPFAADAPVLALTRTAAGWNGKAAARLKLTAGKAAADVTMSAEAAADEDLVPQELTSAAVEVNGSAIPLGFATAKSLAWNAAGKAGGGKAELAGPLTLRLSGVAGLETSDVAFAGPVKASMDAQSVTIESQKPGTLTVGGGAIRIGALDLDGPVKAQLTSAVIRRDANILTAKIAAKPAGISGKFLREAGPLPFTAAAGSVTFEGAVADRIAGTIAVGNASLDLPDAKIKAVDAALRLPFLVGGDAGPGRLTATIQSTADPAPFDPIAAEVALTWKKESFEAAGDLKLAQGKAEMPLTGHYGFAKHAGELRLGPADIAFAPGKLQPSALNPALKQVRKAEGTVRYDGTFAYSADKGLTSSGQVGFENLTLETAQAKVENLNGTLDFTDLVHLRTAPDQILSAARVAAGAAVEGVSVDFSMAAEPAGAVVQIDEAHARLAEGDLDVPGTTLRLAEASNAATIHVKSVSLSRLMENLGTDAVGGTGLFSGVIPVRFGAAGFAIDNAELKAESGGVLNVRLGSAKTTLEAQGEAMRLMVKALENFHYSVFDIALSRPPGEDLVLKIRLEGNNPEVLDGHPFRFNINLTTDIVPLLEALRAGQGLTADILEKAVDVQR